MANPVIPHYADHSNTEPDDEPPDFDVKRLIVRAVPLPLVFLLPMTTPEGEPCRVLLSGSPAAWGALMTLLVCDGWQMTGHAPDGEARG